MKRFDIIRIFNVLSTVKVNKMSEDIASAVLNNHLTVHTVQKSLSEAQEALKRRVLDGIPEDKLRSLSELETKIKAERDLQKQAELQVIINGNYRDIVDANRKFEKVYSRLLQTDVEIHLEKVDRKKFLKGCADADMQLTPAQLTILAPMFCGVYTPEQNNLEKEIDGLIDD